MKERNIRNFINHFINQNITSLSKLSQWDKMSLQFYRVDISHHKQLSNKRSNCSMCFYLCAPEYFADNKYIDEFEYSVQHPVLRTIQSTLPVHPNTNFTFLGSIQPHFIYCMKAVHSHVSSIETTKVQAHFQSLHNNSPHFACVFQKQH